MFVYQRVLKITVKAVLRLLFEERHLIACAEISYSCRIGSRSQGAQTRVEMLPATHELAIRTGPCGICYRFRMRICSLVGNILALKLSTKIKPASLDLSPTIQYQTVKIWAEHCLQYNFGGIQL